MKCRPGPGRWADKFLALRFSVGPRRSDGPTRLGLRRFLSARAWAPGRLISSFFLSCRPATGCRADKFLVLRISVGPRQGAGPTSFWLCVFLSARDRALGRHISSFFVSCRPALGRRADTFQVFVFLSARDRATSRQGLGLGVFCRPAPRRWADFHIVPS